MRVSSFNSNEPFFGASGANRFDAPGCPALPEFKTCYLARTLTVAMAETILHDEMPMAGKFYVASTEIQRRFVIQFDGSDLALADLTGASLKRLGGHAGLSGSADYRLTQQWALAVRLHSANVDGFVYMSRHVNTQKAVLLFDRARHKITMRCATELPKFPGFYHATRKLGLTGI